MKRFLVAAAAMVGLGVVLAGGCWLDVWNLHGEAVVRWSIDGRTSGAACVEHAAELVEIRVIDDHGSEKLSTHERCDAFRTTVRLDEGWYRAELTMIGPVGVPVSATIGSDSFHMTHRETVFVDVDFGPEWLSFPPLTSR